MSSGLSPIVVNELELKRLELEIERRKVELPMELASLGLRGTLTGALVGCGLILALAGRNLISDRVQVTGTHLCVFAGIICATVVAYGAFVFNRSLDIAVNKMSGNMKIGDPKPAIDQNRD
jgi:hypothetical protein